MRIAVDAAGGDHAPRAPVEAALAAAARGDCQVVLVGPAAAVRPLLPSEVRGVELVDAPEVIAADEQPARAIRRKRRSSVVVAVELLRRGEVDGFVSAGDTGALVVAGKWVLDTLPGVRRPALATLLPTLDGRGLLFLDVGAQVDCDPEDLYQFAVMGAVFAEQVLGRRPPRVGLLNIGSEARKGSRLAREAFKRLRHADLAFAGNVEARDLLLGQADVVVADGFVGNLVLKAVEGTAMTLFRLLRQELGGDPRGRLGGLLARPALRRVRERFDYREYGGAPLLGLGGVVVKCHGSSDARAIAAGIRVAVEMVRGRVLPRIAAAWSGEGDRVGEA